MKSQVTLPGLWEILCLGIGLALALSACGRREAAPSAASSGSALVR